MTITDFLLARIADDEARDIANEHYWRYGNLRERLLAEHRAKRRIIQLAEDEDWLERGHLSHLGYEPDRFTTAGNLFMRYLADVYSDHPDYDETWRID